MLEAVLFDLDGTLLRMDQDKFTEAYLDLLGDYMARFGYEKRRLIRVILSGTEKMVRGDGTRKNCDVFWSEFSNAYGADSLKDRAKFDLFYEEEFDSLAYTCGKIDGACAAVAEAKKLGVKVVLASNPIFPRLAMEKRARWAGLDPADFDLVTAYENSSFCKPNPNYYIEIAQKLAVPVENCLMVGNDVREDMVAASRAGLDVFFLPRYGINRDGTDTSGYRRGDLYGLVERIRSLRG